MSFPINDLPKEVLHHVFSYLNVSDRLNASLVCIKWLHVINCKSLLRTIKVLIKNNNAVLIMLNMSRNFLNFEFDSVTIDNKCCALFKRFSPFVEYLSFKVCNTCDTDVIKFDICKSLKILTFIDCDLWSLFPCLPNLTEIHLSGKSIISDDGIATLQKTMKHLKALTLDCDVAVDFRAYKRFYCHGKSYETQPSSLILSLPAIKNFICERARTLKELNLYFAITSKALEEITSIKNLCLTKICLGKCYECASGIINLFKTQTSLKIVHLYALPNVNDDIIYALCNLLPIVEEISIHDCLFDDLSLRKVLQLNKLKKLDIGRNGPIRVKNIQGVTPIFLELLNMSMILVENIDALIKQCKYLLYLDLSYCSISDKVVHVISENLIHLEYLSLKGNNITDYGLTGFEIPEYNNKESYKSLSNLKHLKTLKLNDCIKITDFGLIKALHFQYLEHLYIAGCHVKKNTIKNLLHQNPNIKKIYCDHQIEVEGHV